MSEITVKISNTIKKYNMLSDGDTVVVGVSGGADSMLLLYYLNSVAKDMQLNIICANVEHGIRGQESVNDTNFVKEYCLKNNITFNTKSINAIDGAKALGIGVEEYSRNMRYEFFKSFNADKIATAHNLSDNVETVLFRLSRGTSIKGCCGIPAVRDNIIRPLIDCTGVEIRNACKELGVPYVIDSTNSDNTYSRNYIRNQIVPDFNSLNPSFENVFARFIDSVIDDENFINNSANECFDNCFNKNTLSIEKLKKYDRAIVKRCIVKYLSLYDITTDDLHINGVYDLVFKPGRYQIKNNYFAISDKHKLRIALFDDAIDFNSLIIKKRITSRNDFLTNCKLYQKEFAFFCDYDKIVDSISLRARDNGDSISPAGRDCTKSLKKLYNEYKIPIEDRDNIPVICDSKGIIGIYGYCCDERVKIDNITNNVLMFKITYSD